MGTKIFMELHSNFYNLTAADDGQFKKELPYVMNGKMKLLLTEFTVSHTDENILDKSY